MPKPPVPAGPISFDGELPRISLSRLRSRLSALANDPLLGRVDAAIDAEDWQVAVGLLMVLSNNVLEAHKAAGTVITKINRTRHTPLFPELEQSEEVARYEH